MCGIAGIINEQASKEQITHALASMAHRGPDSNGYYQEENICLLHTRLAIQDISAQGNQPMWTEDGSYAIVYNGEIYNHLELRDELVQEGLSFNSHSDTETLLKAYIHWGIAALNKFNGIFAFVIYDKINRKIFAARDAFGVKPFYYYQQDKILAFGSNIKSIKCLCPIKASLQLQAFYETLTLQWPLGAHTGWDKILTLLPGHAFEYHIEKASSLQIFKWSIETMQGKYEKFSEAEWIAKVDAALNKAVRRQLLSDKPIAYFLSGGLDSSLLLAIAQKIDPTKTTQAFTIDAGLAFQKEGFSNDLYYAQLVAQHLNIPLDVIKASASFLDAFDAVIAHLEEPQADIAAFFVQQIARAAKAKSFDVLIGGVGADDIFSGYRRHQALAYEPLLHFIPLFLRKGLKIIGQQLPDFHKTRRIKKALNSIYKTSQERLFAYFFWEDKKLVQQLIHEQYRDQINNNSIEDYFASLLKEIPHEHNALNQLLHLEINCFLAKHNLNYTDKMGMAESVEIRVPYLDQDLVALLAAMPPELKMKGHTTKYILRKVAEKYLPKAVIYRSKTGFGAPIRSWMQEDKNFQNKVNERLFNEHFLARGIFDRQTMQDMFDATISKQKDHSYTLLALLAIESWLRQSATNTN
jgi:asparagine synthase (glutamine-hydrolysing)